MILAVAATEFEMSPFLQLLAEDSCFTLIAGVGPVETTLRLTRYLERRDPRLGTVLNFGVAGAYLPDVPNPEGEVSLLDLCLAEQESLGDLGISFADHIEPLAENLGTSLVFPMDQSLLRQAGEILAHHGQPYRSGNFVTVSAASATRQRGTMLAARFQGICENMEGAAVARVCAEFSLPLLELRAVSNLVEDRDLGSWKLAEACSRAAGAAALLVRELKGR